MKTYKVAKSAKLAGALIVSIGLLAAVPGANAQESAVQPSKGCTNSSLNGYYGFTVQGTLAVPGGTVQDGAGLPFRGVVMTHFDGAGNLTQVDHGVVNGAPPPADWTPGYGTYSINPDCTGTAVINTASNPGGPLKVHMVVTKGGKEVQQVVDVNAVVALGEKVD